MSAGVWLALAVATTVSLVSPFLIRPLLVRARVVDVPNERSSHNVVTIRGGGVAPLLGLIVGGTLIVLLVTQESVSAVFAVLSVSVVTLVKCYFPERHLLKSKWHRIKRN